MRKCRLNLLRYKLLLTCIGISAIFSLTFISFSYYSMASNLKRERTEIIRGNIQSISDKVQQDLEQVQRTIYTSLSDENILRFAAANQPEHTTVPVAITAVRSLEERINNSYIAPYINKVLICSKNNSTITTGLFPGTLEDAEYCKALPFFYKMLTSNSLIWVGIVPELPSYATTGITCLPIIRQLSTNNSYQGWAYFSINSQLVSDKLMAGFSGNTGRFFWRIGDFLYLWEAGLFRQVEWDKTLSPEYETGKAYHTQIVLNGEYLPAVACHLQAAEWSFIYTIPPQTPFLLENIDPSTWLIGLFILLASSAILLLSLMVVVTRPVRQIMNRIERISGGDLSEHQTIKNQGEFSIIEQSINNMALNIKRQIEEQQKTERNKKELEFKVLQQQINPHFLYNTLNTVKEIADIQGSRSITEMIEALVFLLKGIAKTPQSFITLRQELDWLEKFILIQKYRYESSLTLNIQVEEKRLMDSLILKFTLQPIVENAVFHGIANRKTGGFIGVTISRDEDIMKIEILDNGPGIPPERVRQLLIASSSDDSLFNKIGLKNVDDRIKMEYGESFGLSIETEMGRYTKVTITFPVRYPGYSA